MVKTVRVEIPLLRPFPYFFLPNYPICHLPRATLGVFCHISKLSLWFSNFFHTYALFLSWLTINSIDMTILFIMICFLFMILHSIKIFLTFSMIPLKGTSSWNYFLGISEISSFKSIHQVINCSNETLFLFVSRILTSSSSPSTRIIGTSTSTSHLSWQGKSSTIHQCNIICYLIGRILSIWLRKRSKSLRKYVRR